MFNSSLLTVGNVIVTFGLLGIVGIVVQAVSDGSRPGDND